MIDTGVIEKTDEYEDFSVITTSTMVIIEAGWGVTLGKLLMKIEDLPIWKMSPRPSVKLEWQNNLIHVFKNENKIILPAIMTSEKVKELIDAYYAIKDGE
jgi:hypothetical protein